MKLGSLFDGSIEWRPIKGYENEYLVSEAGDVWSVRSERKLSHKRAEHPRYTDAKSNGEHGLGSSYSEDGL